MLIRLLTAGEAVRQSSSLVVVLFGAGLAGLVSLKLFEILSKLIDPVTRSSMRQELNYSPIIRPRESLRIVWRELKRILKFVFFLLIAVRVCADQL